MLRQELAGAGNAVLLGLQQGRRAEQRRAAYIEGRAASPVQAARKRARQAGPTATQGACAPRAAAPGPTARRPAPAPHRVVSNVSVLLEEALDGVLLGGNVGRGHPGGGARCQLARHAACTAGQGARGVDTPTVKARGTAAGFWRCVWRCAWPARPPVGIQIQCRLQCVDRIQSSHSRAASSACMPCTHAGCPPTHPLPPARQ